MKWIKNKYDDALVMFSGKFPIAKINSAQVAASDGISLIIIDEDLLCDCYFNDEKFPDLSTIFNNAENNLRKETFLKINFLEKILNEQCNVIAETKKTNKRECSSCSGNGSFPCWSCDEPNQCPMCSGKGFVEDLLLTGKKIPDLKSEIKINFEDDFICYFSYKEIKRIIECCKKIGIDEIIHIAGNVHTVNLFTTKNKKISIYVMPLKKPNDKYL